MFSNNSNNYLLSVNNVNKLNKWRIIRKINKQKDIEISDINGIVDLKKTLFWKNSYLVVPDKYLNDISSSRCREFDIYNIYLYQRNCKLYSDVMKKINNSSLKLESSPLPLPKYSNLERQYLYFKRNENTNNLQQTMSILYLIQNGYILVKDLNDINEHSNISDKSIYFESYQAIELAHELSHIRGENIEIIFSDIEKITPVHQGHIIPQPTAPQPTAPQPTAPQPTAPQPTAPQPHILNTNWVETEKKHLQDLLNFNNGNMVCKNPEHHSVDDKVNHYNIQNSKC
jgi:hypothetical protein